jgi:hypothetical protein
VGGWLVSPMMAPFRSGFSLACLSLCHFPGHRREFIRAAHALCDERTSLFMIALFGLRENGIGA